MTKYYTVFLTCFIIMSFSCTRKSEEVGKTSGENRETTGEKQAQINDTVFFGMWKGKYVIIEDSYMRAEYDKKYNEKTQEHSYGEYGDAVTNLVKKYGKYSERVQEYYIPDFHDEFAQFTTLRPGTKLYIATKKGVYPVTVNGYYINLDDLVGAGSCFYAAANLPHEADLEENEIVVCSYNENTTSVNGSSVTDQSVIDKFTAYLKPKLKDVNITEYDENTQKEVKKKFDKLSPEDIRIFKGSFSKKGADEYLVGVTLRNDFTNFTSLIYIMDESGKIVKEVEPMKENDFIYSRPYSIIDFNGDGVWEIISEDGYYEGNGYNFRLYNGKDFKGVANGFVFGV